MKYLILFVLFIVQIQPTVIQAQEIKYLPNPCCGLFGGNFIKEIQDNDTSFRRTNLSIYLPINVFLKDNCFTNAGEINEKQLYNNIKEVFDEKISFQNNIRYIICFGCSYDGNCEYEPFVLPTYDKFVSKVYCWYPPKMYNKIIKQKYPPLISKAIYPERFHESKYVSILDFRNLFVQKVYDRIIAMFGKYLSEEVEAPRLNSSTNAKTKCKKGDFVSRVEISFIGPWGEGATNQYSSYQNSDALIAMVELYKKYLYNYWLVVPSYGMRTNTTPNKNLYPFQYYLLTTTYGSLKKDGNGYYYGNKEFGLGMSHVGAEDYLWDFILPYKNIPFKEIALKKCLKAPFIGESMGYLASPQNLIMNNVKDYGISIGNIWSNEELNSLPDSIIQRWKEAISFFGYRFYITNNNTSIKDGRLNLFFLMGNSSYSPLYDEFWLPQIVIRDKDEKELRVIDIDKDLNLRQIPCKKSPLNYEVMVNTKKQVGNLPDGAKVYFRVIDKCHINENMYLDNDGRTGKGEYLLLKL